MQATAEQLAVLDKFATGQRLKISAFAGTGKTTTLRLLAESRPARGLYVAFNRATKDEAANKFPKHVDCRTTHSLAWQATKQRYQDQKLNTKLYAKQLARELELEDVVVGGRLRLDDVHQAFLMIQTVLRFCQSADVQLTSDHVPMWGRLLGSDAEIKETVRDWALGASKFLWSRMTDTRDSMPLGHDGYLKVWALGRPKLGFEYILLDEAQDTNGAVLGVLEEQEAQVVYVGDRQQQIYEWRGAVNAMAKVQRCAEVYLTQSFRFGSTIADEATRVLFTLGERHSLRGNPSVRSRIVAHGDANTVLARTNATVILEVFDAINAGIKPYVVGGTGDLERLLSDVFELKGNNPGSCPEFFGFKDWGEVVAFADTDEGEYLRTFVRLVEQHGERKLWRAVKSACEDEGEADIVLSTVHKAKGREWDAVRLAPDFLSTPDAAPEVRLFYVAMTRARKTLVVDPVMLAAYTSGSRNCGEAA